jgi:PST family polysaccharide transporter
VHRTGAAEQTNAADETFQSLEHPTSSDAAPPVPPEKWRPSSSAGTLTQQTAGSLAWSAASRVGGQIVQFSIIVVLARLLVPAQFGLVEMYAVFTGFAVVFVDLGLAAALVQRQSLEERHLSSAFWLNLAGGVAAAGMIAALSPGIAAFYGQPRLVLLTIVAGANFIVGAPGIVQSALLQRALNFRRLAFIELTANVISGAVAICVALSGGGVWSLVALTLTSTATRSLILWFSSDWRPLWAVDRAAIAELWRFSGNMLGFTSINYWARNADNLLIGKFIGVGALGIYARAYNTMLLPLYQISGVTSSVMFSALSGIQEDLERVRNAYLRAVSMIALVAFPTMVGLLVVADRLVLVAFGQRWSATVPLLRVLCVAGLIQSVSMTGGWIYQSQGRTDLLFRWSLVTSAATLASFAVGLHWGALGVTVAYAIVTLASTYPGIVIPGRLIGMTFSDMTLAVYKPLASSFTMGGLVFLVGEAVPRHWPSAVQLIVLVAAGVASYGASLRLFRASWYRDLVALRRDARG